MENEKKESFIILGEIDIQPLISTRDFLEEALESAHNKFEIAGAIQAFEVCYELSWKILKKSLLLNGISGIESMGSRDIFRLAAQKELITDYKSWFDYQSKRNITVHEYYGEIEKKVYPSLPSFLKDLDYLINKLKGLK